MIFTQRQLEALHNGNGQIVLPYRARLSPMAQDWVKRKKISLGYADVSVERGPKPQAPSVVAKETGRFVWWCDGPCGPAKGAITGLAREANLAELEISSEPKQIAAVIKTLAAQIKNGSVDGGVLLVKTGAVALVLANRCSSLRAILGTCLGSVDQGILEIAANVLVIEHPYVTLMQARNLIARFVRGKRTLSEEARKLIGEVASCG